MNVTVMTVEDKCRSIINKLKEVREEKKITTQKLSDMTGIAQSNITRMETSESSNPNLKTLIRVCDALGVSIFVSKK